MADDSTISAVPEAGTIVQFVRKKDFKLERMLGRGGCGSTVLLYDPVLGEHFACKKFAPKQSAHREQLFERFVREAKLMYRLQHPNVVRINFHYLYPQTQMGFILMEYIQGCEIDKYVEQKPEQLSDLFRQTIEGFSYLESQRVMHRDIRMGNLLVTAEATLKIIDFGFGKEIGVSQDFDQSVAVNLWCDHPREWADGVYDFRSEVYFVGQIFARLIREKRIGTFEHHEMLARMCKYDPADRVPSFAELRQFVRAPDNGLPEFTEEMRAVCVEFVQSLESALAKIGHDSVLSTDAGKIQRELEALFRSVMLLPEIPNPALLTRCFISGQYTYYKNTSISTRLLKAFIELLASCTDEQKSIVIANVHSVLNAVARETKRDDSDIPF